MHAGRGVREGQGERPVIQHAGNVQRAAAVGVAQAVFEQIIEQLHQPVRVTKYDGAIRQRQVDVQVAAGEAFAERTGGDFQNIDHVHR
ncbi:hypothetical protein D3C78_1064870 [compost metagenome]